VYASLTEAAAVCVTAIRASSSNGSAIDNWQLAAITETDSALNIVLSRTRKLKCYIFWTKNK
jgi:hypothetical protein